MPRRPAVHPTAPLTSEDIANRQLLKEIEPELLGERLRRARQEQKITQRALCKNLFTSAYLSSMELGKTRPTLTTLQQIAERVRKPVSYFLRPAAPGIAGISQGWQQEQGRLLQLRQGLTQLSVILSKGDFAEANNLLDQLKPNLSRLPEADQASFHLWQGALFNRQGNADSAIAELEEASQLLDAAGSTTDPDTAARLDLEYGLAYFNRRQFINALTSFKAGLNRTDLADLSLQRRLQLHTAQCYLVLEQPEQAAEALKPFLDQESELQMAGIAEASYNQAERVNLQQGAFLLGRSEQIWAQSAESLSRSSYYLDYARLLFQIRQYDAALKAAQTAFQLTEQTDPCAALEVLSLLALLSNRLKDNAGAAEWLNQARQTLENQACADPVVVARFYHASGEISSGQAKPEEASDFYLKALKKLDESSPDENEEGAAPTRVLRGEIYFELGQLLRQLGRFSEALDYIEKAYRLQ